MGHQKFLKWLRKELPYWVEQGWVRSDAQQPILQHVEQQASDSHLLAYAFGILGVVLLGSGIITFFAANWDEMSKLLKLVVLIGGMWLIYAIAVYLIQQQRIVRTGHAVLLLGVILFGANVMLIAQIYHIDSHYPNGVLLWAVGALLTAYLLESQAALVAALALAVLWSGMESMDFGRQVHWWFLLFLAACVPLVYWRHWRLSAHLVMIALLFWSVFNYEPVGRIWGHGYTVYLTQMYFIVYLSLFIGGLLFASYPRLEHYAAAVQRYSALAALTSLYLLSFPDMQTGRNYDPKLVAGQTWLLLTSAGLVMLAALAWWHRRRTWSPRRPVYLVMGEVLVIALIAGMLANLFVPAAYGGWMALLINLLLFAGLVWLVFAGLALNDRFMVNLAFVFFTLTLLSRYFDTFWTLLNRSFFFMAGGLILIAGGYWLEKQRRQITDKIVAQRQGGNGA